MYKFKTEQFGITENEIHLLRSRFPYKKIPFEEVKSIKIRKGAKTKHPIKLIIFGLIFLVTPIVAFYTEWLYVIPKENDWTTALSLSRGMGPLIVSTGFTLSIGFLSIYTAIKQIPILQLQLSNDLKKTMSITLLARNGQLKEFIDFLIEHFSNQKFQFDSKSIKF